MCEEVHDPATQVPKAIIGGVTVNFFAGLATLLPIAFVLPDVPMLANLASGQPVPTIFKAATGNSVGAFLLLLPLLVLGITCGISCVTAASRCTWAFARDGAIPGSPWVKQVNPSLDIPLNAMILGMVVELLLGLINFGSAAAFNAFSGAGVIFLTLSYACPVAVSLILRRRKDIKNGRFNLGVLGSVCNVVCLGVFPLQLCLAYMCADELSRMDASRYPTLLDAIIQHSHRRHHELRFGRLCGLRRHLSRLVLDLGLQELCRPS